MDVENVPGWPVVTVEISGDGRLLVDGNALDVPPGSDPRRIGTEAAAGVAATLGRPVRVKAVEEDGTIFPLIVSPDGEVAEGGPALPPPQGRRKLLGRRHAEDAEPVAVGEETLAATGISTEIPAPEPVPYTEPDPAPAPGPTTTPQPAAQQSQTFPAGANSEIPDCRPEHLEVLQDIRTAVESGETRRAMHMAAAFTQALAETGHPPAEVLAAREVEAYVALRGGEADKATRLYAKAAVERGMATPDPWARRLAANAEVCWQHVTDPEQAYELGSSVLHAYSVAGTTNGGQPESARRRYDALRQSLLSG